MNLERFELRDTSVTGASLSVIGQMKSLKKLELSGSDLSAGNWQPLENLDQLDWLDLGDSQVGNEALQSIASIRQLRVLNLEGTTVTDSGLWHLRNMNSLKFLDVEIGEHVTIEKFKILKTHLPACKISCRTHNADGTQSHIDL